MPSYFRWSLAIGVLIAIVDAITLAAALSAGPDSQVALIASTVDDIANITLFAFIGFRVGRESGRATSAAEAGVLASLVPGLMSAVYAIMGPSLTIGGVTDEPLAKLIVVGLAYNVALGGVTALVSGWLATRSQAAAK